MLIDPQLRTRILIILRWLVADTKNRFDDCRGNLENGSEGGYSDKLAEAIKLLAFLENPAILMVKGEPVCKVFTEQQCQDTGILIGLSEAESSEFYEYYERQRARGVLITNLRTSMVSWKNKRHQFEEAAPLPTARDKAGLTARQRDIQETGA